MNLNLKEEIWKPIAGFHNYQVSNRGRIKNIKTGKVLKNVINSHGYAFVQLCNGSGLITQITVHKLVAQAFIPNPNNLPQVNHLDEDASTTLFPTTTAARPAYLQPTLTDTGFTQITVPIPPGSLTPCLSTLLSNGLLHLPSVTRTIQMTQTLPTTSISVLQRYG